MSHRLQVLIPEELDLRLRRAARRERLSKGEWVRRAIEDCLRKKGDAPGDTNPLERLATLQAPTGDIEQMLQEIETGRAS